jgi:hypothetical protein
MSRSVSHSFCTLNDIGNRRVEEGFTSLLLLIGNASGAALAERNLNNGASG